MPRKSPIQIGHRYHRLLIQSIVWKMTTKGQESYFVCLCDCGNTKTIQGRHIANGDIKSCGCLSRELVSKRNYIHGDSHTKLHRVWWTMINRCHNPNASGYAKYGAKGTTVCEEWRKSYISFKEWAVNSGWQPGLTIDRINNSLGYNPNNCRIADHITQSNNKTTNRFVTAFGETKTIANWARDKRCKVNSLILRQRLVREKWNPEKAITTISRLKPKDIK